MIVFTFHRYQVVGRGLSTAIDEHSKIYRMKLSATNGIFHRNPTKIKNYGIWLRYQSSIGYHNMYKEFHDITLNGVVEQMHDEMASRHDRYGSF